MTVSHGRSRPPLGVALFPIALLFAFPLLYLVGKSLRSTDGFSLSPYIELLSDLRFYRWLANSLFLSGLQSAGSVLLAAMAGFALGAYHFRGRATYTVTLVALASLPPQLLLPGGFELISWLGLFNSRLAVLFPGLLSALSVLLYRAAFARLPQELLDAGRVDGATEWSLFWNIALPVAKPTTAACLLLSFTGTYNAVIWPAVTLQSPDLHTLPIALATLSGTALTPADHARVLATTTLALIPILALFLYLQRDFLPGLLSGSVKG